MKDDIKISIIIPVCNSAKYLEQCVTSVTNQSLKEIEIICVDDGSTDQSLEIIRKLKKQDDRINIIEKENSGYGNSINRGIDSAKGAYIGIVESDDFIDASMYKSLYDLSLNGSVDVVKANFWDYYDLENGHHNKYKNEERKFAKELKIPFTIKQNPQVLWGHPSVWSAIYKKSFINENNIKMVEAPGGGWVDNPFFFETLCAAKSIIWSSKPYYYYRKTNPNSSSNKQTDLSIPFKRMIENLNVLDKYNCKSEDILKIAYARAIMYTDGVMKEKNYLLQQNEVKYWARLLMQKLNPMIMQNDFNTDDLKIYNRFLSPFDDVCKDKEKILIYNWIQFDNEFRIGGGVNIYCYNLIEYLIHNRPDLDIYFLSSGWSYDITTTECYVHGTSNVFGDRCHTFEIVNSPVPAAQDHILNHPEIAFENKDLYNVVKSFIEQIGPLKAIHFNNIEGLSLDVLDIKKDIPNTKFIYSIHNYIPFCVTGFYYMRHKHQVCSKCHTAQDCCSCITVHQNKTITENILGRAQNADKIFGKEGAEYQKQWLNKMGFELLVKPCEEPENLIKFCELATDKLNYNMDRILAVSERVKQLAIENGFDGNKTSTSYIGTKIAEFQQNCSNSDKKKSFKIAFLGSNYKFEEKGYPFLMNALENMDEEDAEKIDVLLTTTNGDEREMKKRLKHFHSVEIKHGYSHQELEFLMMGVDLGIIPVLWEDNLPQIAIEMVSLGVPILASSAGGASELTNSTFFKFESGNANELRDKIAYLLNNRDKLDEYWDLQNRPVTMKEHVNELLKLYEITNPRNEINILFDDYVKMANERENLYNSSFHKFDYEVDCIRQSLSYKIGRLITYIPRKIRSAIKVFCRDGLNGTIEYTKNKLMH